MKLAVCMQIRSKILNNRSFYMFRPHLLIHAPFDSPHAEITFNKSAKVFMSQACL